MFLLATQTPDNATDSVAEVYAHFAGRMDVPAPLRLLSASPELLRLQFAQILYFMRHPKLSFPVLAAIRFLAARQADFAHCRILNRTWLIKGGLTDRQMDDLAQGLEVDAFSVAENALLRVVGRVLTKDAVTAEDLTALRDLGWTDADILDACAQGTALVGSALLFTAFQDAN